MDGIKGGWLFAAVLAAGCASDATKPRTVSLSEFAGGPSAIDEEPLATAERHELGAGNETEVVIVEEEDVVVEEEVVVVEEEVVVAEEERPVTPVQYIADSLVGQVNGRPIYADEFFEPIEDELIALAERLPKENFVEKALELVQTNLQLVVLNELFLAEAEAGLTEQQQVGILYWLKDLRERVISGSGGVESATEAKMQAEEGVTLDEFLDETKKRALISQLLEQRIAPRVIVSWRDVEREYERRYDDFNPPSRVVLARIRLSTERQADEIQSVTTRMAAGESFQAIAESLEQWNDGEWRVFEVGKEGIGGVELGEPALGYVKVLSVGGTTPPFEVGSSTLWLHFTSIDQPEGRSLYDPIIQQQLTRQIFAERSDRERRKYIDSLLDEGIYDELNEMADRLLIIALLRYSDA